MELIKEDSFRKLLKSGLSGGYLFFGEEDYLKSHALGAAREAVAGEPSFALFNDVRLDAMDYSASALLDALMPLPMMSEQKIVTVSGVDFINMKPSELDELCDALEALADYDYNVLIISVPAGLIDVGNIAKNPSATYKKLSKYLTPVQFDAISGARLVTWLQKHFSHHGVKADPSVCSFLIEYSGRSMYVLSAEAEKLSYYCLQNGRDTVTREDVENVCVSVVATDAFALANSILDGKFHESIDALSVMKFKRIEPVIILSEVSKVFCDLLTVKSLLEASIPTSEISRLTDIKNEYKAKIYVSKASGKSMARLKRAIELCSEADLALKLSPQGYTAIERLICSL